MKKQTIFDSTIHEEAQTRRVTSEQTTPEQAIPMTKQAIKEIAQEAYQEGVEDAKEQQNEEEEEEPKESSAFPAKGKTPNKEVASAPEGKAQTQHKLDTVVARNNYVLYKTQAIFPFDLFPDTLIIDMTKVSVINKTFFATEYVTAIPLKSIADIFLQTSLFMASITIKYMPHSDGPGMIQPIDSHITSLPRKDAIIAKNIIRGMILAHEEKIDLTNVKLENLRSMMEQLGASKMSL